MTANPMKQSDSSSSPGFGGGAQFSAGDLSSVIAAGPGQHQCVNCGTEIPAGATVCAGCGIRLRKPARRIRCRHCHHQASSQLVICPSCGRHLHPAPSRLLTWGVPLLLALLIGVLLFDRLGMRIQFGGDNRPQTVALGEMVDLPLLLTDTPVPEQPVSAPPATLTVETVVLPTAVPEPSATASPAPVPTETATATQTQIPTASPTATPTATATVTPTPVPTLDAMSYTVQSGDTLLGIAKRFSVTVDDLLAANDLLPEDATRIRSGTVLVIPPGGALPSTVAPNAPPAASPTPAPTVTYALRSGDTLSGIAERFGITVNNLLTANGLTTQDATRLQIGQELIIPAPGQTFPTLTPVPATRTPVPATATPTPAPTQPPVLRLPAPILQSPTSGTPILGCNTIQLLTWQAASLQPGDAYELYVGYISGPPQADGSEAISWAAVVRQTQSSWKLDTALCTQAPQEFNRQWRWYVQIINDSNAVSPPSPIWEFSWNP